MCLVNYMMYKLFKMIPWRNEEPEPTKWTHCAMSSFRLLISSRLLRIETYYWWATIQRTHYFLLSNPLIVTFSRAINDSGSLNGECPPTPSCFWVASRACQFQLTTSTTFLFDYLVCVGFLHLCSNILLHLCTYAVKKRIQDIYQWGDILWKKSLHMALKSA